MDSRQQFEEWLGATEEGPRLEFERDEDGYIESEVQAYWETWQASREMLAVELPDPFWPGYIEEDEPGLCISTNLFTIEQITEALADQGITAS